MKRERTKIHGLWLALSAILVAGLTAGCVVNVGTHDVRGNGSVVEQERSARGFDSVALIGVGNVNVHPGREFRVVVTTDGNIQDLITTEVRGTSLRIDMRSNRNLKPTRLTIDVYMPALRSVRLQGVGSFTVAEGGAPSLELILSGVGDIDARNFRAENVNVNLSGIGEIRTWAANTLTGRLSGIGDVRFLGSPTNTVSRSGIGQIRPL